MKRASFPIPDELDNYNRKVLTALIELYTPKLHPDFQKLPIIMGTKGILDGKEAQYWFYSISVGNE